MQMGLCHCASKNTGVGVKCQIMFVCMLLCVYVCYVCHTDSSTTLFIVHECIAYYACVNVGVCK